MTSSQPSPEKSKSLLPVLIVIAVIAAIASMAYYAHFQKQQALALQKKQELEKIEVVKAEEKKKREVLQALFDVYLNDFKEEIREKAADYKNARIVLKDIVAPYNFETSEYAKENYEMFKKDVAPTLRTKAEGIIGIFEIYRAKIEANLGDKDSELQQTFLTQWKEMSRDQLKDYIEFFAKEEELIHAYDDLITFYYIHSKLYTVDVEANEFKFSREKDEKKAAELLKRLNTVKQAHKKKDE